MNKTLDLGDQQRLNEFAHGDVLRVADREQGLVHIGVQLRSYVDALKTHLGGLPQNRTELRATGIQTGVEAKLSAGAEVNLGGPVARNEVRPLVDSGLSNAERPAYLDLAAVVGNDILLEHAAAEYPMGHPEVNYGKPGTPVSFAPMEETMGERIRRLREARNLTQPALARLLISMGAPSTLSKAAVHKWEIGDTINIQNTTFVLLCQALGTQPEYLLWGADRVPPERKPAAPERLPKTKS